MADKIKIGGKKFDVGQKLTLEDLKKIEKKTDYTPASIIERVKDKYDIKAGSAAKSYAKPAAAETPAPDSNVVGGYNYLADGTTTDQGGMTQEQYGDFLYNSGLIDLQGNINKELEQLRSTGLSNVASIQAGAAVRSAELDAEARKYLGDKDYLARTDVAKIQSQANLDLQNIINAGLKDVEGIRQQGGRDIATITGEFGVKQEAERQRGQKDIAKIGSESAYRNALIGAFSF